MLNLTTNSTYPANSTGTNLGTTSIALSAKVNVVLVSLRARFAFVPMQDVEDAWRQSDQRHPGSIMHRITGSSNSDLRLARLQAAPAWPAPKPSRAAMPVAGKSGRPPVVAKVKRPCVRRPGAFVHAVV